MLEAQTTPETSAPPAESGLNRRQITQEIIVNVVINAVLPLVGFILLSPYMSEVAALTIVAFIPLLDNVVTFARHRRFDAFGLFMLAGLVLSIIVVLLGGDKKFLLVKESLLSGVLGLVILVSLFFPRPMLYYFAAHFTAGNNEVARANFAQRWQFPYFRFVMYTMTVVWGAALILEAVLRVGLVFILDSTQLFLTISPFVQYGILGATVAWNIWFARHSKKRSEELRQAKAAQATAV